MNPTSLHLSKRCSVLPQQSVARWGCSQYDGRRWCFFTRNPSAAAGRQVSLDGASGFHRTPKLSRVEAALFVADGALSPRRLVQAATLADTDEARNLVTQLNEIYDASGSAYRIERVATGYQMLTLPVFATWLNTLHERKAELRLSPPAMETLTIVAYRQPITRADVEAIRGVQSAEIIKHLMERGLVRIGGEDDSLGRPYLYVTTRKFLELFGLRSLNDLPMADRLRRTDAVASGAADSTAQAANTNDDVAA